VSSRQLFDKHPRSEPDPRGYDEDAFTFLNRASGIVWERIRAELEVWYAAYPDETGDLRARFRSRDHRQHYGAWWELYVLTLLSAVGFRVSTHPEIPGSSGRPDFLAVRGDDSFYVEAVTVFSGFGASALRSALEPAILDIINRSTRRTSS